MKFAGSVFVPAFTAVAFFPPTVSVRPPRALAVFASIGQ